MTTTLFGCDETTRDESNRSKYEVTVGASVRPMKTRDVRRRAATRSGRFGAARLRFRLSSGSCLVAVRTGRVRCRVWFYGSTITDAKRFEVIIDGAQHGCGRVANSRNAACTVRRKLHRGARVVSCHVVVARMLAAGSMLPPVV